MANYPEKNVINESGVITPYLNAYGKAFTERFGASEDYFYEAAPGSYAPASAPVVVPVAAPAAKKSGYKKCTAIIAIVLVLTLLTLGFAAISYIGIDAISDYTTIYEGDALDAFIDDTIALFEGGDAKILDYIIPIALLASIVVAFCIFISAIAGLASKNRIMFWIAALIMVVLTLVSAVCYFVAQDGVDFIDFVTPGGDYLQIGFFVLLGLQFVTLILSCFANKKVR